MQGHEGHVSFHATPPAENFENPIMTLSNPWYNAAGNNAIAQNATRNKVPPPQPTFL